MVKFKSIAFCFPFSKLGSVFILKKLSVDNWKINWLLFVTFYIQYLDTFVKQMMVQDRLPSLALVSKLIVLPSCIHLYNCLSQIMDVNTTLFFVWTWIGFCRFCFILIKNVSTLSYSSFVVTHPWEIKTLANLNCPPTSPDTCARKCPLIFCIVQLG